MKINPLRILVIESHPDDGILGCAGLISKIKRENKKVSVWLTYMADCKEDVNNDGNLDEHQQSCGILGIEEIIGNGFQRNILENYKQDIRDVLTSINKKYSPDLVLTHSKNDFHQDHSCVGEVSLNVFRNSALCLSYESPSVNSNFKPQLYISLSKEDIDKKIEALHCWQSQYCARPYYFNDEIFKGQMRFRGSQVRTEWAEAFEVCGKV